MKRVIVRSSPKRRRNFSRYGLIGKQVSECRRTAQVITDDMIAGAVKHLDPQRAEAARTRQENLRAVDARGRIGNRTQGAVKIRVGEVDPDGIRRKMLWNCEQIAVGSDGLRHERHRRINNDDCGRRDVRCLLLSDREGALNMGEIRITGELVRPAEITDARNREIGMHLGFYLQGPAKGSPAG